MAKHRSQSRSFSPRRRTRSPPPRRRKRYDDDSDRRRDPRDRGRSPAPSGLLVRNLPLDARPDDLRIPFERYGPVKDVYLPRDYNSGKLRGFGFVKYRFADHAAEAKQKMNLSLIGGREIRIVYADENRKTPQEMRSFSYASGRGYRRTPSRSPRRRHYSSSRSPSPVRARKYNKDEDQECRDYSKSQSPGRKGKSRAVIRERSPNRSLSPVGKACTPSGSRSRSYSPR